LSIYPTAAYGLCNQSRNLPGKPTIRGLRYTIETVLDLLSSGMTIEEILADYEDLEQDDILAVLIMSVDYGRGRTPKALANFSPVVGAQRQPWE